MIKTGRIRIGVTLVALALLAGHARAEGVVTLQELVRQWVDLRGELAESNRASLEQEAAWRQEIALLEEERSRLQAALDSDVKRREADLTDRSELVDRRNELKAILEKFPGLLDEVRPREPDDPMAVSRRLQHLLADFAERDDLHHSIQSSRQVLEVVPGTRKEVDVLCLGLARAFAVSDAGDWAAVGTRASEDWIWTPRPDLAAEIRRAIAMVANDAPAAFVDLPLQAVEVGE